MRGMKRIVIALSALLLFVLCSCGSKTDIAVSTTQPHETETGRIIRADYSNFSCVFDESARTLYLSGKKIATPSENDKSYDEGYFYSWFVPFTEKIVVENGAEEIEKEFFERFYEVKQISIPATVKTEEDFIGNCEKLEMIYVDSSNPYLTAENGVLFNKSKTKLIKYPAEHKGAKYVVSETVTDIYQNAFCYADGLTELVLPPHLTPIEYHSLWFSDCENLERLVISEENQYYCTDSQGVLYNKEMTEIICVPAKVTKLIVPDTVTVFDGGIAGKIKELVIGENFVMKEVFSRYPGFDDIERINVSEKNKYYSSEDGVLYNKDKTEMLWYPQNKEDKIFTVPDTVETVGFINNCNLEELILSDSVRTMDGVLIVFCNSLKKLHLGKNVEKIIFRGDYETDSLTPLEDLTDVRANLDVEVTVHKDNKHFKVDSQGILHICE